MIYTKKGDGGTTSLADGNKVSKDNPRIVINGEIDELSSFLGVSKCYVRESGNKRHEKALDDVQLMLMDIMSQIAGYNVASIDDSLHDSVLAMEREIDNLTRNKKFEFVVPGESLPSSFLHIARTKARKVERLLVANGICRPAFLKFFNRLSDFLYVLAVS